MDLIYNILDEISGNPPASRQVSENSVDKEENRRRDRMNKHPAGPITEEDKVGRDFTFSDIDGESTSDSHPWQTQDSRQWESHSKQIQVEFSRAPNPEQSFKISKDLDLDSFCPKEGWLNLDDLVLKTSPSVYPPPPRPAPVRDTASSPSTSGQEYKEGEQEGRGKGKEKEQFLMKVSIKRHISYELVEEDVYDDQPEPDGGRHVKQPEQDLIDISTVDLDGKVTEDKIASELSEEAHKQVGKVTRAIEEDLSVLFGNTSVPFSPTIVGDRKGKAVVGYGSRGTQQPSAAVAEMKERDVKRQREMEEILKAGDELEAEFKRWSAGKEGNIRALLSSLHNILGPEFGWQPIGLKDLLESASVRKQYKRATLLVHPDKLQQKGATPQQKYIAEKVFSLLKDASKKLSSQELF